VTIDTEQLAKEVDKLGGIGRQIVIGVVLVGMLIGSAIATSVLAFTAPESEFWDIIFRVAYFGYIFAMILAAIIVIKLVWDWIRGKSAI
jgi:multisubunit Na+/H+ antiporter MnhE subunit